MRRFLAFRSVFLNRSANTWDRRAAANITATARGAPAAHDPRRFGSPAGELRPATIRARSGRAGEAQPARQAARRCGVSGGCGWRRIRLGGGAAPRPDRPVCGPWADRLWRGAGDATVWRAEGNALAGPRASPDPNPPRSGRARGVLSMPGQQLCLPALCDVRFVVGGGVPHAHGIGARNFIGVLPGELGERPDLGSTNSQRGGLLAVL